MTLKEETKTTLDKLFDVSNEFVQHRHLAVSTRFVTRSECKYALIIAEQIQKAIDCEADIKKQKELLKEYNAHYSFDFSQSLWLYRMSDTPKQFYLSSFLSINLFGIVDDGGIGGPKQTNLLYDQTTERYGSSFVHSMLYRFLFQIREPFGSKKKVYFHADNFR